MAGEHHAPLNVAMIGGGLNSAVGRVHEIAMRMDGKFELVAGCFSRNPEINQQTAIAYRVDPSRVYPTPQALYEQERGKLDAIVIATPSNSHGELINQALDHEFTVITDKPTVATVAEAESLLERLGPDTNRLFTIFNYTGYPIVREMKSLIAQGAIGDVFRLMIEMPQDGFLRMKNTHNVSAIQAWRLQDGEICGLSLDLFTHIHSMALFLTGARPVKAQATMRSISNATPGLIDDVDAIVEYDNGMIMNAWYGKAALGYRNGLRVRVFGTRGSMHWEQMNPEGLMMADAYGDIQIKDRMSIDTAILSAMRYNRFKGGHPAGFIEAFANYYSDIAISLQSSHEKSTRNLISLESAIDGLRLARNLQRITAGFRFAEVAS